MASKYFYIVDHFEPFPRSEYGGLWNVIADNDEECFDLIVEEDGGFGEEYYSNLRQNINNARVFALSEDSNISRVVESFTT
tara:strand:+ start:673 stop:915 length:243 start_codon:yes stop_codon:yes gene_type:complete